MCAKSPFSCHRATKLNTSTLHWNLVNEFSGGTMSSVVLVYQDHTHVRVGTPAASDKDR